MRRLICRPLLLFVAIPLLLLTLWMLSTVFAQSKQCVCHVENRKTGAGHVIQVDQHSRDGHLRHGDTLCNVDCDTVLDKECNVSTGGQCSER